MRRGRKVEARIEIEPEAKLVNVEVEAAVEITDEDRDGLKPQVGILTIESNAGVRRRVMGRIGHEDRIIRCGEVIATAALAQA